MKNAPRAAVRLALVSVIAISCLALGACSSSVPNASKPQLTGVVTSVDVSGDTGQLLVVWDASLGDKREFDAASLAITKDTAVFRRNADGSYERMGAADIKERDVVEVQITGPVRESYPVQAEASQVIVIDEWPASKPLPTPPGLQPPQ